MWSNAEYTHVVPCGKTARASDDMDILLASTWTCVSMMPGTVPSLRVDNLGRVVDDVGDVPENRKDAVRDGDVLVQDPPV